MTYAMKFTAPLFLATLATAQVAQAGSANGTTNVSGNVQGDCTISAVALNFVAIPPGSAKDAEGSIGGACTTSTTYTITIDSGSSLVDTNSRLAETERKTIWSISSPLMNSRQPIATSQPMAPWSETP